MFKKILIILLFIFYSFVFSVDILAQDDFDECWDYKSYTFLNSTSYTGYRNSHYAVGDVNNDGYIDVVALRYLQASNAYMPPFNVYLQFLENKRKDDGGFEKMSIGETKFLYQRPYTTVVGEGQDWPWSGYLNVGNFGEDDKNVVIVGNYNKEIARSSYPQDESLWVEWKSDSNLKINGFSFPIENSILFNRYLPQGIKNIDLDDDGKMDMVFVLREYGVANQKTKWVVMYGSGDEYLFDGGDTHESSYGARWPYGNASMIYPDENSMAFGDFWGNGYKGVVWYPRGFMADVIYYENNKGVLGNGVNLKVGVTTPNFEDDYITSVASGDFNDDGRDDIAVGGRNFLYIYESVIEDGKLVFNKIDDLENVGWVVSMSSLDLGGGKKVLSVLVYDDGLSLISKEEGKYKVVKTMLTEKKSFGLKTANFDDQGAEDLIVFSENSAQIFFNKCSNKRKCNVCQLGDKTKGDANCDGKITMVDFEIWRNEYFDIKDTNYDWQSSFSCVDELKRPSMVDFGIWRKSYFGV